MPTSRQIKALADGVRDEKTAQGETDTAVLSMGPPASSPLMDRIFLIAEVTQMLVMSLLW